MMEQGLITNEDLEPVYREYFAHRFSYPYTISEFWKTNDYIEFKGQNPIDGDKDFYFAFDRSYPPGLAGAETDDGLAVDNKFIPIDYWQANREFCVPSDNDSVRVECFPYGADAVRAVPLTIPGLRGAVARSLDDMSRDGRIDFFPKVIATIYFKPSGTFVLLTERPGYLDDPNHTHPFLEAWSWTINGVFRQIRNMYFPNAGRRWSPLLHMKLDALVSFSQDRDSYAAYEPQEPFKQYKAIFPDTGEYIFSKIDANNYPVSFYDPTATATRGVKGWVSYQKDASENFFTPRFEGTPPLVEDWVECLGESEQKDIHDFLIASPLVKERTQYIIIGDEPELDASAVIDIKASMKPEEIEPLKELFTHMPRMYLFPWFNDNVIPKMDDQRVTQGIYEQVIAHAPDSPLTHEAVLKAVSSAQVSAGAGQQTVRIAEIYGWEFLRPKRMFEDMTWAGFIDFFNECNLAYCNQNQIEPWAWEDEKLKAYYVSQDQPVQDEFLARMQAYEDINLAQDPKVVELLSQYKDLPSLGDPGLEISRQNAIRELLARGEYDAVKGIIEAYRSAEYTVFSEVLNKPIPFDIDIEDGEIIKATPPNQGE